MPDPFTFDLVSPEKLLLSENVEMVVVPGVEGDFGVLIGHSPLISELRPGVIDTYTDNKVEERIFVAGGFAEVTGERCTVLAEEAMPVEGIDAAKAETRIAVAREALVEANNDLTRAKAQAALAVGEAMVAACVTSA